MKIEFKYFILDRVPKPLRRIRPFKKYYFQEGVLEEAKRHAEELYKTLKWEE